MKIAALPPDYSRAGDLATQRPRAEQVAQGAKAQEIPVEHLPLEEPDKAPEHEALQRDTVNLSELAQTMKFAQEALQAKVHEELGHKFEAVNVDLSEHIGLDYTPDAVSQRIVDFSLSLYGVFKAKHPHLPEQDAMARFEEAIRGAVDDGYQKAIKLFETMKLPPENIQVARDTKAHIDRRFDEHFRR